jgi:hypothetical protein
VPPSKSERLALVPSPTSVVAHLDKSVIGQNVAKRRLALGVSNHFKRVVDTRVADDPIVTDPELACCPHREEQHPAVRSFWQREDPSRPQPGFRPERPPRYR